MLVMGLRCSHFVPGQMAGITFRSESWDDEKTYSASDRDEYQLSSLEWSENGGSKTPGYFQIAVGSTFKIPSIHREEQADFPSPLLCCLRCS